MRRLRAAVVRLLGLALRARRERDLAAELDSHLQLHIDDNVRAGMTPAEARRQALLALGGVEQTKERVRDARATFLDSVRQDVVFALRLMRRTPVVTAAAILSIGLGIGGTAGVLTLADAALVRDLPVPRPGDLSVLEWRAGQWPRVAAWSVYRDAETGPRIGGSFAYETFRQLARAAAPSASVAAFAKLPRASLVAHGQPWTAETLAVSGGYFDTVGVRPERGRLLLPSDDVAGAPLAAVVSHRFWQRAFGGEPEAVGRVVTVNGRPFTIVGIAEQSFFGLRPGKWVDLYLPLTAGLGTDPDIAGRKASPFTSPAMWWFELVARRTPGSDVTRVERALDRAFAQSLDPSVLKGVSKRPQLRMRPGNRGYAFLVRDARKPVSILMTLAGLVLLIACANVANLLLARSSARRREWAMRLALGASRLRVARQHLTEGALFGVFGGAVGLAFAGPVTHILTLLFAAGREDRWYDVGVDWRVLACGAALSALAGLLLGGVPVARLWKDIDPGRLRGGVSSANGGRRRSGLARPLVATQIALSLAMLVASGLFVRSLQNLYAVPLGFNPDGILLFDVDPVRAGYGGARRVELLEGIRRTLAGVPQVRRTTRSSVALVDGQAAADIIRVPGRPVTNERDAVSYVLEIGPDFHETLQVPLVAGRPIGEGDDAAAPLVAVVNESFARKYFPGEVPLGREVLMDYPMDGPPVTIVGVVRDGKYSSVRETTSEPVIYLADAQRPRATATVIAARVDGEPGAARSAIVQALRRAYPALPLSRARTFAEQLGERLATDRLLSLLSTAFGVVALLLAAIGLYGVMAFSVTRRSPELGIRAALGATRGALVALVLRDSASVIGPGIAVGVGLALGGVRLIRAQLFGLSPTSPATIVAAACTVSAVALVATYVPARRASRVDPTEALRCE